MLPGIVEVPRPVGRILSAVEAGLYGDAAGALAEARQQAARMLRQAEAEIAIARAEMQKQAEHAARVLIEEARAEATAATARSIAGLRRDIAQIIAECVAKLVGRLNVEDAVQAAAECAIADLAGRHGVTVHVHPSCADTVRARLGNSPQAYPPATPDGVVRVVGDPSLPRDACTLETDTGIVRAGLSEQMECLRTALMEAAGAPDA